jgi:hypothetical protein
MRKDGRLVEGKAQLAEMPVAATPAGRKRRNRSRFASEAEFQAWVIDTARMSGWRVAHFRPAWQGERMITPVAADGAGFPDLILVKGPHEVAAELKVEPNTPSDEQLEWLVRFALAGRPAYLWYPRDEKFIELLLRGA